MAVYSSILMWEIPRTEEPGELQSMGSQKSDPTEHIHLVNYPRKKENNNFLKIGASG